MKRVLVLQKGRVSHGPICVPSRVSGLAATDLAVPQRRAEPLSLRAMGAAGQGGLLESAGVNSSSRIPSQPLP